MDHKNDFGKTCSANRNMKSITVRLRSGIDLAYNGGTPSQVATYQVLGSAALAGVGASNGWSAYAGVYEEFRIKKVAVNITSAANSLGYSTVPMYVAFDEKTIGSGALGIGNILEYDDVLLSPGSLSTNLGRVARAWLFAAAKKRRRRRVSSVDVTNFFSTASPATHPGTLFFTSEGQGPAASTINAFVCIIEYTVEFRTQG